MHSYVIFVVILTSHLLSLHCSSSQECLSGNFDTITRTSDGNTYAFQGGLVIQLTEDGTGIVSGYPKPIDDVFPGLLSNLDASILYPSGKSYFYKGDKYWRTTGTTVDSGYPRNIGSNFIGIPTDLDAALVDRDSRYAYFFKGDYCWYYDIHNGRVVQTLPIAIRDRWPGIVPPVDAAFQWSNGAQYFFSGDRYYRFNDREGMVADGGYPLPVASAWLGCQEDDAGVNWIDVCNPDLCSLGSECLSSNFDTITRTSDGNTYAFQGGLVVQLTEDGNGIVSGYPKPICAVFPGLPSNLDASILYPSGKSYFFKGVIYWRTTGTTLDSGYPKDIATNFVGIPSDLDAASVYGDSGNAYFFKGDEYWRYDLRERDIEHTLPMAIRVGWPGIVPPVDAAFQSSNGRQYFFSGDRYWRQENNSYPLDSASNWLECSNGDHGMGWIDVDDRELCSLTSGLTEECLSGIFDTITTTSDGNTYAFKRGLVVQLTEDGNGIVSGYPKPICAVFPGLPSNLDASLLYPSGKNYFFKGDKYWRTTGTTIDKNYPMDIVRGFIGVPINIDAALLYGDSGNAYFFKGKDYWRFNLRDDTVNHIFPLKIRDGWNGIDTHVDAAFQWSDGRQYLFNRGMYWRYNATGNRAADGYPLPVTSSWLGCQEGDSEIDWTDVCEPDLCTTRLASRCLSGRTDAITHILTGVTMGNIFAFRGSMVTKLTPATGDIVSGYPKPICSVFPGLPAGIDAALTWKDTGKTYFFKGNLCYRFSTYRLDKGYPRPISDEFPGVPNDIDAAVVTGESGNQNTYFFKDNGFYKYDRTTASVPLGYPQFIQTEWPGLPDDIDAAVQWINGWTYLFKDDQFYRWDYIQKKVARRYPRPTGSVWFGCQPLDEVNNCWVPQCF